MEFKDETIRDNRIQYGFDEETLRILKEKKDKFKEKNPNQFKKDVDLKKWLKKQENSSITL